MPSFWSLPFFVRMCRDTIHDPFSPLTPWTAPFWVAWNWSWLRQQEALGWPLPGKDAP